jgi:hypothetical protein
MEDPLISGLGNFKKKENLLVLGLGLKDLTNGFGFNKSNLHKNLQFQV